MVEWWICEMPSSCCSQVGRLTSRWFLLGSFGAALLLSDCDGSGAGGAVIAVCHSRNHFYHPLCGVALFSGCCCVSLLVSFLLWFPPSNSHATVILIGLRKIKCNRVSNEVFWLLWKGALLSWKRWGKLGGWGRAGWKAFLVYLYEDAFTYPSCMLHDGLIFVISVKFQHSGISPKL